MLPVKQKPKSRPAHTPLAWPHAAAGLKLCFTPVVQTIKCTSGDVFTPADDRFIIGELAQLFAQCERLIEPLSKAHKSIARTG